MYRIRFVILGILLLLHFGAESQILLGGSGGTVGTGGGFVSGPPPGYFPNGTTSVSTPPSFTYTYPGNYPSGVLVNWVKVSKLFTPATDTDTVSAITGVNKMVTTLYSDGLGRSIQSVATQTVGDYDIVSAAIFDSFGRRPVNLLPFTSSTNYGGFKTNALSQQASYYTSAYPADADPYSVTAFDDTSLYSATLQMKPGTSYVGSGKGNTSRVMLNKATENIRQWDYYVPGALPTTSAVWADNTLVVEETLDQAGMSSRKYVNKDGQTVLTKVQVDASPTLSDTGWLCTYYVYDSLGRVRSVIPPLAVNYLNGSAGWAFSPAIFRQLCYSYLYDNLGRVTAKSIPGRSPLYMVYDSTNRPVLVQDGNMADLGQWMFIKYDVLGRKILTGVFSNSAGYDQPTLQSMINGPIISSGPSDDFLIFLQTNIIQNTYNTASTLPDATIHNIAYYDNYSNAPSYFGYSSSIMAAMPGGPNAIAGALSGETYTMPTGGYTRVMNGTTATAQWTSNVAYYDPNGRVIQSQGLNFKGGVDTMSIQYDFAGALLNTYSSQFNPLAIGITHVPWVHILKTYNYNANNQLASTLQRMNGDSVYRELNAFYYDNLNRLDIKQYGSVETQRYSFRLWGDLEAINKTYCQVGGSNNYFGEILSYDYGFGSISPAGLPSGLQWRLKGSPTVERAYGYSYDNAGRLSFGGYSQSASGAAWQNATENYTAANMTYDANGNLLTMTQVGTKPGYPAPFIMDSLNYTYDNGGLSNHLLAVSDSVTTNYDLGEFNELGGPSATDYAYDANGNAIQDVNRNISSITYNYSNKPCVITFNGGRSITFIYDANGAMLSKQVADSGGVPVDTIDYLGGLQYKNDSLVYAAHDEGRARPLALVRTGGDTTIFFEYDYFIKDHQGNVRSVATEVVDSNWYTMTYLGNPIHGPGDGTPLMPAMGGSGDSTGIVSSTAQDYFQLVPVAHSPNPDSTNIANQYAFYVGWHPYTATMELASAAVEDAVFSNIDSTRDDKPMSTDSADTKASMLNAAQNKLIGPSMVLRVMAGDSIYVSTQAYYNGADQNDSTVSPIGTVISGLLGSLAGGNGAGALSGEGGATSLGPSTSQLQSNFSNYFSNFGSGGGIDSTKPRAFLNYIVLDDQMNIVEAQSGSRQVVTANAWSRLALDVPVAIAQNGYVIVFVSNTSKFSVGFDNLLISHYTGSLQTENHYYPYGLTITTNAITAPNNNILYQSNELHHNEFANGTGLNWYSYGARMYDPQIGRWHASDPMAESQSSFSPYHYCFGNPVVFMDPSGLFPTKLPQPAITTGLGIDPFMSVADGSIFYANGNWGGAGTSGFTNLINNFGNDFGLQNWTYGSTNSTWGKGSLRYFGGVYYLGGESISNGLASNLIKNGYGSSVYNISPENFADITSVIKSGDGININNISSKTAAEMQTDYNTVYSDGTRNIQNGTLWFDQGNEDILGISLPSGKSSGFLYTNGMVLFLAINVLTNDCDGYVYNTWNNTTTDFVNPKPQCDVVDLPIGEEGIESLYSGIKSLFSAKKVYTIYQGLDELSTVRYIGITGRDPFIRFAEHLASDGTGRELLDYFPVSTADNILDARIIEQNFINEFGMQKNGGLLLNQINSINPIFWDLFGVIK